jgi:hypothetical protein
LIRDTVIVLFVVMVGYVCINRLVLGNAPPVAVLATMD